MKLNCPNIISASRGVAALAMLFLPVFSPGFWILYCWGGISDMIDGPLARKLGSASETGATIDSVADFMFVACSSILILPLIDFPLLIWLWIAAIAASKITCVIIGAARHHKLTIPHSTSNRMTGILLFCLPLAVTHSVVLIPSVIVCTVATFSLLEDIQNLKDKGPLSPLGIKVPLGPKKPRHCKNNSGLPYGEPLPDHSK